MNARLHAIAAAVGSTPSAAAALNVAAGHALEGDRAGAAFFAAAAATLTVAAHPELGVRAEDVTALLLGIVAEGRVVAPPTDLLN